MSDKSPRLLTLMARTKKAKKLRLTLLLKSLKVRKKLLKNLKSQRKQSCMVRESFANSTSSTISSSSVKISRRLYLSLSGPIPITSPFLLL